MLVILLIFMGETILLRFTKDDNIVVGGITWHLLFCKKIVPLVKL